MGAPVFIARKIRFKGRIATISIALSFFVMIIAVSVASGYRKEILDGLRAVSGDIRISSRSGNFLDDLSPVPANPSWLERVRSLPDVVSVTPVVYRAGIVTRDDLIHGVVFKGVPEPEFLKDTDSLVQNAVSVPRRLAEILSLSEGDKLLSYFVGEKTKLRNFAVVDVYDAVLDSDDKLVIYTRMSDLQRVNGWSESEVSAFEVNVADSCLEEDALEELTAHIGTLAYACSDDDNDATVASSSFSLYPQMFDWLHLIDFNVYVILILMTVVAGFNMISGLLILLFENISTIGLLKAVGMTDKAIAKVFLWCSSALVLKGTVIGNVLALLVCFVQNKFHIIKLDPQNYFVSAVPANIDIPLMLSADVAAFVLIMLMLVLPCLFISKIDPAKTIRVE